MADVKEVCGQCGAEVARTDLRCGACGETLVREGGGVRCGSCGYRNPEGSVTCASCGVRLAAGSVRREKPVRRKGEVRRSGAGGPQSDRPSKRLEPWQVVSFVAVGGLLVLLLYLELSRDHGTAAVPRPAQTEAPGPAVQMPSRVDLRPLEEAVAARPDDHQALLRLANGLHDNGAYMRAVDTYKKYLAVHPTDADARVDMGICYYELGLADTANPGRYFDLAVAEMEAALRGSPNHQQAAFNLGVVNLQRGELEESNRWFRRAVAINAASELGQRAQRMAEQHSMNP